MQIKKNFIEDLYDIYKGGDIWIMGAGKSLDDFPMDFFDNKISIALNGVIHRHPNCTWWLGQHEKYRKYLRDENPEYLKKSIILYPFTEPFEEQDKKTPELYFGEMTSVPYWAYLSHDANNISLIKSNLQNINLKKKSISLLCWHTVLHGAIQAAFLMGAKNIFLAGCENKIFVSGQSHSTDIKDYPAKPPYTNYIPRKGIEDILVWLSQLLIGDFGVPLMRYYNEDTEFYKKGYHEIK